MRAALLEELEELKRLPAKAAREAMRANMFIVGMWCLSFVVVLLSRTENVECGLYVACVERWWCELIAIRVTND
jgi:hypothetical protein